MENRKRKGYEEFENSAIFSLKVALIVFAIYVLFAMGLAPFSSICSLCHSKESSSHKISRHKQVSCSLCHGGMTTFERLNFRISLVRMIPSKLIGVSGEDYALVKNQTCLRCHAGQIKSAFVSASGIRVSHTEITAGGYECVECHSSTGHSLSSGSARNVDMFECFRCHNGVVASSKCSVCHPKEGKGKKRDYVTTYQVVHRTDGKVHGIADLNTCGNCHEKKECRRCHVIEIPHPREFLYVHRYYVKSRQFMKICFDCHNEKSFCLSCHQMEMPHPKGFLKEHSNIARKSEEKCLKCHSKNSCLYCHERHRHPGIPKEVLLELRRRLKLE